MTTRDALVEKLEELLDLTQDFDIGDQAEAIMALLEGQKVLIKLDEGSEPAPAGDPAACLHAGCHPGRCAYGSDHGRPATD